MAPQVTASAPPRVGPRNVDPAALEKLEQDARKTESSALIVIQHGKLLSEVPAPYAGPPIQTMSITKSVLALIVGCLVDRGKLALERPVHELFPEWKDEGRRRITIEHLLTHSSGLEEGERTHDIYASRSFVAHAAGSKLVRDPGTKYEYGNRASNLLSGVIARAAGKRTDEVARECLFAPLGITRYDWSRDRAGDAHGLAGLHLVPRDLARLGELVLAEGAWQGRQIISRDMIRKLTTEPARVQPDHKRLAHLWWLLPAWTERTIDDLIIERWRASGVDSKLVRELSALRGKKYRSSLDLLRALADATSDPKLERVEAAIWKAKLPDARTTFGPIVGSYAAGTLGQYLVIVPEHGLVAVRMRRAPKNRGPRDDIEKVEMAFPDFPDRVVALLGPA